MSIAPETDKQPRPESERDRLAAADALFEREPPPMITSSIAAFRRDLPELLKRHRGRWVAYHGDERVGIGRTKTSLYQECLRRGLRKNEFIVCGVEESTFEPDAEVEATLDV